LRLCESLQRVGLQVSALHYAPGARTELSYAASAGEFMAALRQVAEAILEDADVLNVVARLCGDGPEDEEDDSVNAMARVSATLLGR